MNRNRWLLPEGVRELLPPQAGCVETLRRRILDNCSRWGYELVEPPLVEYLESLLTGIGRELDVQTFKLVDQHNGRSMGVRADITPQVARIDAHRLNRGLPTRLCYIGPVLHARGDEFGRNRNPLQVGAELYGHAGVEADLEVIELMLATLELSGVQGTYLDLGHVGIFHALAKRADLGPEQRGTLFDMMQRKSAPELAAGVAALDCDAELRDLFVRLVALNGSAEVLDQARALLAPAGAEVAAALDNLDTIGRQLQRTHPEITVHYDLAEFRAYDYQTGLVFATYRRGHGQEIARGGRYDDMGSVFGAARAATGFSTDLLLLAECEPAADVPERVFAPPQDTPALREAVARLRAEGRCVVCALPGQRGDAVAMGCSHQLTETDRGWQVSALPASARGSGERNRGR